MLAMDVWCFSKSTIRVDLEKHQTRLHYWGNSLCNFEEAPLQFWVFLLCTKQMLYVPAALLDYKFSLLHEKGELVNSMYIRKADFLKEDLHAYDNDIGYGDI